MEPHSSVNNTRDETYYRTPAFGPEDVICPGSDSEETAEQTRQKRLRYERQARRYLRGYRPILLSASLRGPFSRESGWVNPWGRSQSNVIQGGLRQGSKDAASTQAVATNPLSSNAPTTVLPQTGRKYDHVQDRGEQRAGGSLVEERSPSKSGYSHSAEVLAWQARVDGPEMVLGEEGSLIQEQTEEHAYGANLSPRSNSETGSAHEKDFARGVKRARDSQWLMGSYVSKRARWDGPALSSPTPGPVSHPPRDRVRRACGSPEQKQPDQPRTPSLGSMAESPLTNTLFSAQIEDRQVLSSDTLYSGLNTMHIPIHQSNIENGIEDGQEQKLRSLSRRSLGKATGKDVNDTPSHSLLHLQQDDFDVTPASETSNAVSNLPTKSTSGTLPKLPRPDHRSPEFEDSFVSEVAPSSRNVEQFRFKKRKRRTESAEQNDFGIDDTEPHSVLVKYPPDERSPKEKEGCVLTTGLNPTNPDSVQHQDKHYFEPSQSSDDISEEYLSRPPEAAIKVENLEPEQISVNISSPQGHEHFGDNTKVQAANAIDLLAQSQDNRSNFSDSQVLVSEEELGAENGDVGSFNLGDMSFLRAVLRAGNSAHNTQSSQRDGSSVSEKSVPAVAEQSAHRMPYLADSNLSTSKGTPSSLDQKIPSMPLSRQIQPRSSIGARQTTQSLVSSSRRQSRQPPNAYSSPLLPELHISSPGHGKSLSMDDEVDQSHLPSCPSDRLSPDSAYSSPRQTLPEKQASPESAKPSQDPNDFSTQSYNTTPFKSQRSIRRLQSSRKSIREEGSQDEDPDVLQVRGIVMDKIQLELSQICPSSSEIPTPSESIVVDIAESPRKLELEADKPLSCKDTTKPASQQKSGTARGCSPEAPGIIALKVTETHESDNKQSEPSPEHSPLDFANDTHMKTDDADDDQLNELDRLNDSAREASEVSWEGCGPQSPWAIEIVEPVLPLLPSVPNVEDFVEINAFVSSPSQSAITPDENSILLSSRSHNITTTKENNVTEPCEDQDVSSEWQHVEQPQTPEKIANESFKELAMSIESPKKGEVATTEALTDTQLLDAAMNNPWATSLKKPSTVKKTKRVSFGKMFSQSQVGEDSQPIQVRFGPASQSVEEHPQDEDHSKSHARGSPSKSKIPYNRRQFRRILPEIVSSPLHSSPAVDGQAEAFIAADRATSIEQEPSTTYPPSKHLQPRSETESNLAWKHPGEPNNMLWHSYMRLRSPSPLARTSIPGFDMEEALGVAGEFLEDWSVDAELKKANRPSDTNTSSESNGFRRRRLFGLV